MHAVAALGFLAFSLCLVATPLCRNLFIRLGITDKPDTIRKLHKHPTPRAGGVAIAFSYAAALLLLLLIAPHGMRIFIRHKVLLLSLLAPAGLVFATGLVDDLKGLKPRAKLLGLAIASVLAVALGARITLVNGHPASPWITIPLSIFWLLACSNALNLIDGLDGLASGVALFATLTTLLAAVLQGNTGLVMATVPLAGCLLAFLRYNFNPASVFLGDCGSLTIGFLLGCFGLIWSQKSATFLGMAAPMMVLALPLMDVSLAIGRRYISKRPIFQGDRGHIHHQLLALGFTPRYAALILYGVCGVAAALSLLQSILSDRFQGLIVILFCCLAVVGVNRLKYIEFSVARELFSRRTFLRFLQERAYSESLRRSVAEAATPDACWQVIATMCRDLHFSFAHLEYAGHNFAGVFYRNDEEPTWKITLTLGSHGMLYLTRVGGVPSHGVTLRALQELQDLFAAKDLPPASGRHFIENISVGKEEPVAQ